MKKKYLIALKDIRLQLSVKLWCKEEWQHGWEECHLKYNELICLPVWAEITSVVITLGAGAPSSQNSHGCPRFGYHFPFLSLWTKKIIRSSHHGFTNWKWCFINLIAWFDGVTSWVNEGRAADIVYFNSGKAFDTISHNILIGKHRKCGLDDSEVDWELGERQITEGCDQWCGPSWRLEASGVPQGTVLGTKGNGHKLEHRRFHWT